jgi:hypothetical protein
MRNSPQHVECANHEEEDGPELRDVSTDEAEDGDTEEDESQHHGQRRMVKGPGDAGEEDHDRSLSLDLLNIGHSLPGLEEPSTGDI